MYTPPNDAAGRLADYRAVLLATKDDPSMVAYYAFHGVQQKITESIIYLQPQVAMRSREGMFHEPHFAWLKMLRELQQIKRAV